MRSLLLAGLLSALLAPAVEAKPATGPSAGEQELAKLLAGRTPGKPVSCLMSSDRSDSRNIAGVGILYKRGRTYWLNRFENGCTSMTAFDIVVTVSPGGQLCRGDIVRIVDHTSHFMHDSCSIGDYVPYTLPNK